MRGSFYYGLCRYGKGRTCHKGGGYRLYSEPWEKEKLLATLSAALKLRESRTEINTLKQRVEALGSLMIPALRLSVRAMSCRNCLPRLPN